MKTEFCILAASILFFLAAGAGCAEGPRAVVAARTVFATSAAHAGKTEKLAVIAHIRSGYHINSHKPSLDYLIPTKVTFGDSPSVRVEKVVYPRGMQRKFVFLDSPISVYEGEILLGAILKVNSSAKPGTYTLQGKLTYQACNDHACLPPASVPLKASVRVVSSSVPLNPINSEIFRKISFK